MTISALSGARLPRMRRSNVPDEPAHDARPARLTKRSRRMLGEVRAPETAAPYLFVAAFAVIVLLAGLF
jgi:hypothetical protein